MALSFAGVPLCDGTTPAHPDVQSWLEWVRVNIRAQNVFPLDINTWNGISKFGGYGPDMPIRPQVLYWPVGATRWAHFHVVANQEQVTAIRKKAPSGTGTLSLSWYDETGTLKGKREPSMTLLPPKPISEETDSGLFLLTFVDDRYFWWRRQTQSTGTSDVEYTWEEFFDAMASALGVTVIKDTVNSAYSNATINVNNAIEFIPPALDMAAYYFGQRIVRTTAGVVYSLTASNSKIDADNNAAVGKCCRAGGSFFLPDLHYVLPSVIKLHFPRSDNDEFDVVTTTTGPYAATNSTVVATAGSTAVALTVSELKGITGNGKTKDLLTTYQADYSTGSLSNGATMDALCAVMASDYYLWSMLLYDKKWTGIVPLIPDAFHDIEWTYSGEEVSTRMIPWLYEGLFFSPTAGAQIFNSQITFNSSVIFNGPVREKRYAVAISGNTDNLAIGTTNGSWIDITTSGGTAWNLTGMTGGSDGRLVEVTNNINGSATLTLVHNATSTAANRFYTYDAANMVLAVGESAICKYSSAEERWIVLYKQCVSVRKNSTGSTFTRKRINFIEGSNVTLTVADDATNNEIDVTIAAAGSSGGLLAIYVKTATGAGTHTTGASTNKILVRAWAGGGGGGGATSTTGESGGGGAAGSYVEKLFSVSPSTGYSFSLGAGGAGGGTGAGGSTGSDTTFTVGGTTITAKGGTGGAAGSTDIIAIGGTGALVSTGGDVNGATVPGSPGFNHGSGTGQYCSGNGGSTALGGGGLSTNGGGAGTDARANTGSGGSGATGASASGGNGAAGLIIVEEYS